MKKKFLSIQTAVALMASTVIWIAPPTALIVATGLGCAGHGTYNPSTGVYDPNAMADKLIVSAQKTRGIALDVFDLFLATERANEVALAKISPNFHKAAEEIRANGKTWINDLTKLIGAYQTNRTVSNQVNLQQALATIQSALASAQSALTVKP